MFFKKRRMSVNFRRVVLVGKDSFASASVEPNNRMEAKKLFKTNKEIWRKSLQADAMAPVHITVS